MPFDKKASKVTWLIVSIFLILIWSILVVKLVPESIRGFGLLIYYALGLLLVHKLYKRNLEKVIYECADCKTRYKGSSPEEFSYKDWSKKEYKKSFKKGAQ